MTEIDRPYRPTTSYQSAIVSMASIGLLNGEPFWLALRQTLSY